MKEKILLWIDGPLHFGIAYYLKKTYDCELFAIFDITSKPKKFFLEQKLVKFEKIWFYHDHVKNTHSVDIDYLQNFEKKFNINLWKLAINERIFYRFYNFHDFSHNEILSIEEDTCKFFENVLKQIKPDYFLSYLPAFHHLQILYELCLAQEIKPLILSNPIIGYKTRLSSSKKIDNSSKRYAETKETGRTFQNMLDYLNSFDVSKQLKSSNKSKSETNLLRSAFEFLFLSENAHVKTHYTYFGRSKSSVLKNVIKFSIAKIQREKFMKKNLIDKIDLETSFVYFPLGVEPEANILITSPFYTNQIELIRSVSKSLPVGYQLYVKENPSQVTREWRDTSEYKEIIKIPNVKLLHPSFSNKKLLEKSSLVITIAGTSGFEAVFYGKPSIVFGDTIYTPLPSVHRVRDIEKLPEMICESLFEKVNPADLDRFLVLLEKDTFDFDLREFHTKISEYFYNNGTLFDREISESQMNKFLINQKESFEKLSLEHIKKIERDEKN